MVWRKKYYNFYYDEAFHDRKITESKTNKGELNIENNDQSDNFISVNIGLPCHLTEKYLKKQLLFESNAKKILGIENHNEFKGSTIRKRNFKFGIASFNQNTIEIYSNFFNLFDNSFIFQISILNKFEFLISSIIEEISSTVPINIKNFTYSLVKILNIYKNKELISVLLNPQSNRKDVINNILSLLDEIIEHNKNIDRKIQEVHAAKNIKNILITTDFTIKTRNQYPWNYSQGIHGLLLLLQELKIKQESITLYIDQEDNTVISAKNYNFKKVVSVDSKECVGVRIADIWSNFIGRFLKSIEDEYKEDWDLEETKTKIAERRILSAKWFKLTEDQYNLYKIIADIFFIRQYHWTLQTNKYPGYTTTFMTLIYYIGREYSSYKDFKSIDLETHREYFNAMNYQRERDSYN